MINKLITFTLVVITNITLCLSTVEAADLHAVLVGDTEDESLGVAFQKDLIMMYNEMVTISQQTGLKLNISLFSGKEATPQIVLKHLKSLSVKSDDVVFLYFTIHGFRTYFKINKWPNLLFGKTLEGVEFEYINEIIQKKKPRLLISLADCCNDRICPFIFPIVEGQLLTRASTTNPEILRAYYHKLFLETKGSIIASASKPGQSGWYYVNIGGIFTMKFLETLAQEVQFSNERVNWNVLFDIVSMKVFQETEDCVGNQDVQYEIKTNQ